MRRNQSLVLKKLKVVSTVSSLKLGQDFQLHTKNHLGKLRPSTASKDGSEKHNSEPMVVDKPVTNEQQSLVEFGERCPPGGSEAIIFYTTSLRGIRNTFEDCSRIRLLLETMGVLFRERDVSMDSELKNELWRVMGRRVVPPKLFIRGRHIGGADEVTELHEQGRLQKLLEGMPRAPPNRLPCSCCDGFRFLVCFNCNGSCRVFRDGVDEGFMRCPQCNENGLVRCPSC